MKIIALGKALALVVLIALLPTQARAANPWDAFNLAPTTRTLAPVSVYQTSGNVSNPNNLLSGNATRLTGSGSRITLDFGKEVGGFISLTFAGASDTSESVGLAYSESSNYVGTNSDDSNGSNGGGTDGAVFASVTSTGVSSYTTPAASLRGGFRYLTLFLNSNGWVDIKGVSLNFTPEPLMSNPAAYPNYFYCNDNTLNQLWYAGAYTTEMDVINPAQGRALVSPGWNNAFSIASGTTALVDGAKRDRAVWSGDVGISGSTLYIALGDTLSVKNSLNEMYSLQKASGELPYGCAPFNLYSSDTYHMWTLLGTYTYYQYSGDTSWLASVWSKYQLGMSFILAKVNGSHGLLNVTGTLDWARGDQGGENIEANVMLYRVLVTGAQIATVEGNSSLASTWSSTASTLKSKINSTLWNAGQGAYQDNPSNTSLFPEDGNSMAVVFGVTDATAKNTSIASYLRSNWSTNGSRTPEWKGNVSPGISPFPGSFELQADAIANSDVDMLNLIRREWGFMYNSTVGTKTFWEGYNVDGSYGYSPSFTSNCHGWSTGPTVALTYYTLGVMPTGVKGSTYSVIPHPGDLTSAQGQLTVDTGKTVVVNWTRSNNNAFSLTVTSTSNSGSTGVIGIPTFGQMRTITVNGSTAWNGTSFTGATGIGGATSDANYVYFNGVRPGNYVVAYTGSAATWQTCASENGLCSFSGTKGVRYGSGSTFVYGTFTNGVTCGNTAFGDPTFGVAKHCEVSDTVIPPTIGIWTQCAAENGTCTTTNTQVVAYGANGLYNTGQFNGAVGCNNTTFPDPAFGVVKSCYVSTQPLNGGFETPVVTDYAYGASGGSWAFTPAGSNSGSGVQREGTNGSWFSAYTPEKAQTAFLQSGVSISQTLPNMTAGSYSITFYAA